jgi:hypothetical protein
MPYQGEAGGSFWLLVGADGVSLRRSDYDLHRAVRRIQASWYPDAEKMAQILLQPRDPEWVADFYRASSRWRLMRAPKDALRANF